MFFRIFQHLLPNAKAWRLTATKKLREFFEGLTGIGADLKAFIDGVWLDIFPQTTRQIPEWETQFGLSNTVTIEQEKRDRLDATWKASGGQDQSYIQETLRAAGFDVFIHEWWDDPGDEFDIEQDLKAGGDGPKERGWNVLNSAFADAIDIETTNPGRLTIDANTINTTFANAVFSGVYIFKDIKGDFDISIDVSNSNPDENNEGTYLLARDTNVSAEENWVGINQIISTNNKVNTRNTVNDVTTDIITASGDTLLRITRIGAEFKLFSKATIGVEWTLRRTVTRNDFTDTMQVGIGAVTGNATDTFVAQAEYFRFVGPFQGPPTVRNPLEFLNDGTALTRFVMVDGALEANDGNPEANDGAALDPTGFALVNKDFVSAIDAISDGDIEANDGAVFAMDGAVLTEYIMNQYVVPVDPTKWPYFLYIGGQTFPSHAIVPVSRKNEFETLCLKICPAQQWLGMLITYA